MLGIEAKLFLGTVGSTATTEYKKVISVTQNFAAAEIDASTREVLNWKITVPGQNDATITVNVPTANGNAQYEALRSALFNRTMVAVKTTNKEETHGYDMDCHVFSMNKGEPIDGLATTDFTLKPGPGRTPTVVGS